MVYGTLLLFNNTESSIFVSLRCFLLSKDFLEFSEAAVPANQSPALSLHCGNDGQVIAPHCSQAGLCPNPVVKDCGVRCITKYLYWWKFLIMEV